MTLGIDQPIQQKFLSFGEFFARYGIGNRYELIDGEVFDLEPTGQHEEVAALIISSNWQNDYARKVEDYGTLGIPEYWIADYAGLGGIRHIGKPKQPTLSICTLVDGEYEIQLLRGNQTITSTTFPDLNLMAEQVLRAGIY